MTDANFTSIVQSTKACPKLPRGSAACLKRSYCHLTVLTPQCEADFDQTEVHKSKISIRGQGEEKMR
jgi:hypothetical protein